MFTTDLTSLLDFALVSLFVEESGSADNRVGYLALTMTQGIPFGARLLIEGKRIAGALV